MNTKSTGLVEELKIPHTTRDHLPKWRNPLGANRVKEHGSQYMKHKKILVLSYCTLMRILNYQSMKKFAVSIHVYQTPYVAQFRHSA